MDARDLGAMEDVLDQGQVIWETIEDALSSILDEGISMAALDEVGHTLVTVAGQAQSLADHLPDGKWKERVSSGLALLMELGPEINGKVEPLKDLVDEATDIASSEWTLNLHRQLVGENANPKLRERVEQIMDLL